MQPHDESTPPQGKTTAQAPRWAIWRHQFDLVRAEDRVTYLRRWWIVATPYGGIILHRMTGPDARTTMHDHPFHFLAIVLRGGYTERRLNTRTMAVDEQHRIRWVNRMRPWDAHAIHTLHRPTVWTLLFVGRKRRTWGFWDERDAHGGLWQWTRHDQYDSGHYVPDETWVQTGEPVTHHA